MDRADLDQALTELECAERRLRHAVARQDQRAAADELKAYAGYAEAALRGTTPDELEFRAQKIRSALGWALIVTRAARADATGQLQRIRAIGNYTSNEAHTLSPASRIG